MLDVGDIVVSAGGRRLLDGISFSVGPGEVLAVVGPNGSGKTTLLETIAGLRNADRGVVKVENRALESFDARAAHVAYMPDAVALAPELSLRLAVALPPDARWAERFELGSTLDARATEVSRGEAKRALLCATLSLGRRVVLLDEPFAAFDPLQLRSLVPIVRDATRDAATVMTVHQMHTAEIVADRILMLCNGRCVAHGTLEELRARARRPGASLDDLFVAFLAEERDAVS